MRKLLRYWPLGLLPLLVGCGEGLVGVSHKEAAPGKARHRRGAVEERLPRVEVITPKQDRLERRLDVSAVVEALKAVDLSARIPGVVKDLDDSMDLGRQVKAGEVLLRLDVPELEADLESKKAQAEQSRKQEKLAAASLVVAKREVDEGRAEDRKFEADVEYSRLRHGRIRELVKQRAQEVAVEQEAQRQLESARAALVANRVRTVKREARVEAALAELELAKQKTVAAEAEVRRLTELVGFATVKAPFDGVITRRWVHPGATIKDPGHRLLTIMQVNRVRVLIDVPQRDVPYLNADEQAPGNPAAGKGKGDAVTVRIPALSATSTRGEFPGTITRMSGSLDPVTRTMRAEVELDNRDGDLKPGMFGSATVSVEDRSNVMTIPASALVRRGEGEVGVYMVTEPTGEGDERRGVLKLVRVVLGLDNDREVEIRGYYKDAKDRTPARITGSELIVARATGVMRDGETVLALSERER